MTIKYHEMLAGCPLSSVKEMRRDLTHAVTLKRYLNLTLRGTKKDLAENNNANKGRQSHAPSPYTFDQPEIEKTVQIVLRNSNSIEEKSRPPNWVSDLNTVMVTHNGEAPIFTENLLPLHKNEQVNSSKYACSRPQSGISTKSAPVIINGAMYYRQHNKHAYLQASMRPSSAMESRMTRGVRLRNRHKSQLMSGIPSDGTKDELQRMKAVKPPNQNLNKDLLPIPCHTNETTRSFLIGARYNCSNFMDSRSFSCLGLYVPRKNPVGSFLKAYKKKPTVNGSRINSDGLANPTSVHIGGSTVSAPHLTSNRNAKDYNGSLRIPAFHHRRLVKESWLIRDEEDVEVGKKESHRHEATSHLPSKTPNSDSQNQQRAQNLNVYEELYRRPSRKTRLLNELHLSYKQSMNDGLLKQYSAPVPIAEME